MFRADVPTRPAAATATWPDRAVPVVAAAENRLRARPQHHHHGPMAWFLSDSPAEYAAAAGAMLRAQPGQNAILLVAVSG